MLHRYPATAFGPTPQRSSCGLCSRREVDDEILPASLRNRRGNPFSGLSGWIVTELAAVVANQPVIEAVVEQNMNCSGHQYLQVQADSPGKNNSYRRNR